MSGERNRLTGARQSLYGVHMETTTDTYTTTVCTDCAMLIANGEAPHDLGEDETAAWLANFEARNAGIYWALDGDDEDDFSWSACGTCGSSLGGTRLSAAGWAV